MHKRPLSKGFKVHVTEGDLAESAPEPKISNERKIWQLLDQYKEIGVGIIVVLALLWCGVQSHRWLCNRKEQRILNQFAKCDTLADQLKWAEGKKLPQALTNLSGSVFLKAGHEAYRGKEYGKAHRYYALAVKQLSFSPFLEQAKKGYAFSAFYAGQKKEGEAMLKALAIDKGNAKISRQEALYALAFLAYSDKDLKNLEEYGNQLRSLDVRGNFSENIEILKHTLLPNTP